MEIWPAIDLRGGCCVRLKQGDYNRETVFSTDPAMMARRWVENGANHLHLVDLDGAKNGTPMNLHAVEAILKAVNIPCELGGGIRSEDTIQTLLELGLSRVVIGTLALKQPEWFRKMSRKFPGKLVLGIDAKNGLVATDGWLESSSASAVEMARQFTHEPLASVVYTDISTDGMMQGPNVSAMREMKQAVSVPVIASGGVTTLEDVHNLCAAGLDGCIIGRALYEGTIHLRDVMKMDKT